MPNPGTVIDLSNYPPFLKAADVQKILLLSRAETYNLIRREKLSVDLGPRVVRVSREVLAAWVAARCQRPAA